MNRLTVLSVGLLLVGCSKQPPYEQEEAAQAVQDARGRAEKVEAENERLRRERRALKAKEEVHRREGELEAKERELKQKREDLLIDKLRRHKDGQWIEEMKRLRREQLERKLRPKEMEPEEKDNAFRQEKAEFVCSI